MSQFDYKNSYRRNLPHLQPRAATLFVTFRLTGSLPKPLIEQWRKERKWLEHLQQANPVYFDKVSQHRAVWFAKFEEVLDGGFHGPLWLGDEKVANQVADSLHYRDGRVYRLDAFSIMPNHCHVLFKPSPIDKAPSNEKAYHSLASIMQSLKGFTAHACNSLLDREGEFWAHESYDHYVRNHEEWLRIVSYILNNPVKARYVDDWRNWKWNYKRAGSLDHQTAN
jgi:REP-associated tyrosine transposase